MKIWQKIKNFFGKIYNSDFIRTFKEEIIIVPLLLLAFYLFNQLLLLLFPQGAFFDFASQIETIVSKIVLYFITLWVAHLALKMSFPKIYKFLHDHIYFNFDDISKEKKIEYAIKFILVFILAAAFVFSGRAQTTDQKINDYNIRTELVDTLNKQLIVKEISNNRGTMIDIYNTQVGVPLGSQWCGSFVGTNLTWLDIKNPNSAYSPTYARDKDIIWRSKIKNNTIKLLPGDVTTYYSATARAADGTLGRVNHVGFYEKTDKNGYFITIEGNVKNRVKKLKREPNKVYAVSRYIKIVPITQ